MAALRDIKKKIEAVKKTRQITRAMNMVAAAKLRQVQEKTERFRPYASKFGEVLSSLAQGIDPEIHPLLQEPEEVKRVGLILLTADRGLCGAFNMNLVTRAERFIADCTAKGQEVVLYAIGRRGRDYFRKREPKPTEAMVGAMNVITFDLAIKVAKMGLEPFLTGEVQEVYIIYSQFLSMLRQLPTVEKLLPIEPAKVAAAEDEEARELAGPVEYLTEPSAEEILVQLLPKYVNVRVYRALLETATSEHAARLTAMDNASKNCEEMIENLTLAYNKARQASITAELMDIVGGAEALRQGAK